MKKYIKLNNNDNHLSWGNFTRIIKENTINKTSALQVEIFNIVFDNADINDTTVNNYCIGIRSINNEYKQKYITYKKKYQKNKYILIDIILNILTIINGNIYTNLNINDKLNIINNNNILKKVTTKLYNVSKNDKEVTKELSSKLLSLINENNIYEALAEILFFIILDKKQPIYEENIKKETIENLLTNTLVAPQELEEYLNLKFSEGINYNYSLNILADKNNTYALYELGTNEYKGYIKGYPRYDISYKHFKEASQKNHPSSYYMMAKMLIDGKIGNKSIKDLKNAYEYLNISINLGNIASLNLLGNMYKEGLYVKKDINKAITLYEEASLHNYAYAYNNLGKIYEDKHEYEKAFKYYEKSSLLGESYALNKLGEYYRQGIYVDINLDKAFSLYNKAIEVPIDNIYPYAFYNLAKYFYLTGDVILVKDLNKTIEYLTIGNNMNNIESSILLLYIYIEKYLKNKNNDILNKIKELVNKIENHPKYNNKIKEDIENNLLKLKQNKKINIDIII